MFRRFSGPYMTGIQKYTLNEKFNNYSYKLQAFTLLIKR